MKKRPRKRHLPYMKSLKISSIILCGGKGVRSGSPKNKVLCYFGIKTALEYCLDAFAPFCDEQIVVSARDDIDEATALSAPYGAKVVLGGDTRTESVRNGLAQASGDIVLIHDGARPFVNAKTIDDCIISAIRNGSGIAAIKAVDALKTVCGDVITGEIPRESLYQMQTPQAFRLDEIKAAYEKANGAFTDDSAVYKEAGFVPYIVLGSADNKKITTPEDMISTPPCQKIGCGMDFHTFAQNRKLILGGVHIPYKMGLIGNSDADVVAHAIMDALLSAIGEPDIGVLFPCTDEYKDADSIELLRRVIQMVSQHSRKIISVSVTIMAQAPKMAAHIPAMRKALSEAMNISTAAINISATTTEGLGVIGEGKGIAAGAVCLLQ
ncbi:MAG: 2-C-methyl-D-erythritol 2,4-cyclodiphosphate synthase [Clostridiales bacterium]|nr:2-C-methyl-D-erythritol 2,4-cyclodiphosphate synthase [Clostridiales bacterium]